jgi:hypothetical protein
VAVSRVPRIILDGDEESASYMAREGIRQLGILKGLMSFNNLQQDIRKVEYIDGSRIVCRSCFGEDVVHIYAEKDEWAERELIPRFFAFVTKEDRETGELIKSYHWIYFNPDNVNLRDYRQTRNQNPISISAGFEMYTWKAGDDVDCLRIMKNTPRGPDHTHKHPHRHTKSFMMDGRDRDTIDAAIAAGEELQEERYVSACHILTKNKEAVFMPLHATADSFVPAEDRICDILDPTLYPVYPLPYSSSYYLAYVNNIIFTGLNFPCPPRRFYCNTEEGIMAWYTTNPTVVEAQDFICGVIYNIREQTLKTFIHYPSDVQYLGFTAYWAVDVAAAEIPTPLMFDLQSLTPDEINIAIAWSKRPINCKTNLRTASRTYSELESCTHIRWMESDTGFEAQDFVVFDQCKDDVVPESEDDIIDISPPECSGSSPPCSYSKFEYYARKTWSFTGTFDWHSTQEWDLLGNDLSVSAIRRGLGTSQYNRERIVTCHGTPCHTTFRSYAKDRFITDNLLQQIAEIYSGRWVCPNALDLINNKHKIYCDADAKVENIDAFDGGTAVGFMPTEDQMNNTMCEWTDTDGAAPDTQDYFTYPCFNHYHNDKMPDDWAQVDVNTINYTYIFGYYHAVWERETDVDTSNDDTLHKYQVDENLEFSYGNVDHIYYLDDRATDDNQGVIAAGKGDSVTELYTDDCLGAIEYKPDYWKVYWKVTWDDSSTEYVDITDQLLELLDCTAEELLDIGLI